ncbi:MAG: TetR/AcrR family transcriptional regulator [Longimicrobiales bacterium]
MGITERREREKEQLRTRIVEAARDILSETGLDGLSVRSIAERIEYSPATIYVYFQNKDEVIRAVVAEAFCRLGDYMRADLAQVDREAPATARLLATSRAYVRFALENAAYFRVMFELPAVAHMECAEPHPDDVSMTEEQPWDYVLAASESAVAQGEVAARTPQHCAVLGWGLIHGLTSLYLAGHLRDLVSTQDELWTLVEAGLRGMFGTGSARSAAAPSVASAESGVGSEPAGKRTGNGRRGRKPGRRA